jgi:hypothetical protein
MMARKIPFDQAFSARALRSLTYGERVSGRSISEYPRNRYDAVLPVRDVNPDLFVAFWRSRLMVPANPLRGVRPSNVPM